MNRQEMLDKVMEFEKNFFKHYSEKEVKDAYVGFCNDNKNYQNALKWNYPKEKNEFLYMEEVKEYYSKLNEQELLNVYNDFYE